MLKKLFLLLTYSVYINTYKAVPIVKVSMGSMNPQLYAHVARLTDSLSFFFFKDPKLSCGGSVRDRCASRIRRPGAGSHRARLRDVHIRAARGPLAAPRLFVSLCTSNNSKPPQGPFFSFFFSSLLMKTIQVNQVYQRPKAGVI